MFCTCMQVCNDVAQLPPQMSASFIDNDHTRFGVTDVKELRALAYYLCNIVVAKILS